MYSWRTRLSLVLVLIAGCAVDQAPAPVAPVASPDLLRCDVQVYCILGLANVYSLGLYNLVDELRASGIPASAVSDSDYPMLASNLVSDRLGSGDNRPLVLVGHSYGADDCLRVAETLRDAGLKVSLVILIDPTSPPQVPDNIDKCINYYISELAGSLFPDSFSGNPVEVEPGNTRTVLINQEVTSALGSEFTNVDHASFWIMQLFAPELPPLEVTNHLNLDSSPTIHKLVQLEILKLCS